MLCASLRYVVEPGDTWLNLRYTACETSPVLLSANFYWTYLELKKWNGLGGWLTLGCYTGAGDNASLLY